MRQTLVFFQNTVSIASCWFSLMIWQCWLDVWKFLWNSPCRNWTEERLYTMTTAAKEHTRQSQLVTLKIHNLFFPTWTLSNMDLFLFFMSLPLRGKDSNARHRAWQNGLTICDTGWEACLPVHIANLTALKIAIIADTLTEVKIHGHDKLLCTFSDTLQGLKGEQRGEALRVMV